MFSHSSISVSIGMQKAGLTAFSHKPSKPFIPPIPAHPVSEIPTILFPPLKAAERSIQDPGHEFS